jgi:copper resistance protein B
VILQPRFEADAAAQATRALATGAGFTNIELGARLRYEIVKEFAPYVGIN